MGCQYANDLSVNNDFGCNCVNSGYLPDDGPSGRTGWSWMTWVMGTDNGIWALILVRIMLLIHGLWTLNMVRAVVLIFDNVITACVMMTLATIHWCWYVIMLMAKGHRFPSDMAHGFEMFMIWPWHSFPVTCFMDLRGSWFDHESWCWGGPWAWLWYWNDHDTEE